MPAYAKVIAFLKRFCASLACAFVLTSGIAFVSTEIAGYTFVPLWIALLAGWPYVARKLNFKISVSRKPRPRRPTAWGRVIVTGWIALLLPWAAARLRFPEIGGMTGPIFWIALYYGWPHLKKRLSFLKQQDQSIQVAQSPSVRSFLLVVGRGVLALGSVLTVMILVPTMILLIPMQRAKMVHNSVQLGMSVQQVLDTTKDVDIFQAGSEFPHDDQANSDEIPAMSLSWRKDGSFVTADGATGQPISLTESEAIDRMHAKLHDGYKWYFHYTYINLTPMHISFDVVFGPDGRVCEVTPVRGWD